VVADGRSEGAINRAQERLRSPWQRSGRQRQVIRAEQCLRRVEAAWLAPALALRQQTQRRPITGRLAIAVISAFMLPSLASDAGRQRASFLRRAARFVLGFLEQVELRHRVSM
jgi:hypothetical protein